MWRAGWVAWEYRNWSGRNCWGRGGRGKTWMGNKERREKLSESIKQTFQIWRLEVTSLKGNEVWWLTKLIILHWPKYHKSGVFAYGDFKASYPQVEIRVSFSTERAYLSIILGGGVSVLISVEWWSHWLKIFCATNLLVSILQKASLV